MILQTGGSAFGEISTKSKSISSAMRNAWRVSNTPGSTFSPTRRIFGTLILSLMRWFAANFSFGCFLLPFLRVFYFLVKLLLINKFRDFILDACYKCFFGHGA